MKKRYWVGSLIVFILAVICFIVFGVGTEIINVFTGAGKAPVFGKYDGKEIALVPGSDFANAVQNYSNYFQREGYDLNDDTYFYVYSYAFNAAVQSTAYKDAVRKSGYAPSAKAVMRVMLPYFYNNGKYDPSLFAQVAESDRTQLKNNITESLTYERFQEDVFGTEAADGTAFFGLKESAAEAQFIEGIASSKRGFNVAYYNKNDYPAEEVIAFANENKDKFTSYPLSVVSFDDEAEAKKVHTQLTNSEVTFEDAVSEFSKKYYSNSEGKITNNYAYQLSQNIADSADLTKITSLTDGQISEVIKMYNGYAIFRCDGEPVQINTENDSDIQIVRTYIRTNEYGKIEDYFMTKANALVTSAKEGDFAAAAASAGAQVADASPFPLNYGELSFADKITAGNVPALANAGTNENFLEKAFALKENEISEPIVNGNYILVLKLANTENVTLSDDEKEHISSSLKEFDGTSASIAIVTSPKVQNTVAQAHARLNGKK